MYAVIDFSEEAKRFCVFSTVTLKIFIYDDDDRLLEVMDYNTFNLEKIEKMNIPIIEKYDTESCEKIPKKLIILGRLPVGEVYG